MKEFFHELFGYTHSCNQRLIELFEGNAGNITDKVLLLQSHVLNAHRNWNARIYPNQSPIAVWQSHELADFRDIDRQNYANSLYILEHYELTQEIDYTLSNGQAYRNTIQNMLFQVINHSTYHRAQIATECKKQGIPPLVADFIFYKR